jgi:hypothetical protein
MESRNLVAGSSLLLPLEASGDHVEALWKRQTAAEGSSQVRFFAHRAA